MKDEVKKNYEIVYFIIDKYPFFIQSVWPEQYNF